jgi:hypothetical protein
MEETKLYPSVQCDRRVLQHVKIKLSLCLNIGSRADIDMVVNKNIPSPLGTRSRTSELIANSFIDCVQIQNLN